MLATATPPTKTRSGHLRRRDSDCEDDGSALCAREYESGVEASALLEFNAPYCACATGGEVSAISEPADLERLRLTNRKSGSGVSLIVVRGKKGQASLTAATSFVVVWSWFGAIRVRA